MKTTNKITEMKAIGNYTGVQAMDSGSLQRRQ